VPYIDVHTRRDVLSIALANDGQCWPGATSLRAQAWVRYRFSKHGFARDIFRSNQFYTMSLTFQFLLNKIEYGVISLHGAKIGQLFKKDLLSGFYLDL